MMGIEKLIKNKAKSGKVTVAEIVKTTGFSRAYVHRFFQKLKEKGELAQIGNANRAQYVLAEKEKIKAAKKSILSFDRTFKNKNLREDEVVRIIKKETGIFDEIGENTRHILDYAFTEMLNNAVEHSGSADIKTTMKKDGEIIKFEVIDWGVGIFEKLIHMRHLVNVEEAIQDLLKGKQTTDPESHSGEGIFFTRRIAKTFSIRSSNKKLFFNNVIDDFTIVTIKPLIGTRITFTIDVRSRKKLRDIFSNYEGEQFEFGTTEVVVRLYKEGSGDFISRSQARRLVYGLEKFKKIIVDFDNVRAVGQGFIDEIFRVWQARNPDIKIIVQNANDDIDFMVKRVTSN